MFFKEGKIKKLMVLAASVLLISLTSVLPVSWGEEVIDRILAVVNDEVITLTDVNIVERFVLFDVPYETQDENLQKLILDQLINQKLVIQMTSERVEVSEEELESVLSDIVQKTDPDLAGRALLQFGLDWDDLKSYLREKLLYRKIISLRFDQGVIVSIEEIERYYEQVYIPSQREKNLDPQPMIDVLDQIESALKRQKVEGQIQEWISNLKREANIQIKIS
jgi:peptidyl-prolyl cis-trans isomerase SurA